MTFQTGGNLELVKFFTSEKTSYFSKNPQPSKNIANPHSHDAIKQ